MTDERAIRAAQHTAVSEEHVRLAKLLGGGQGRGKVSERCMYYRKPLQGQEAGWIIVNGTNPERQQGLFMKGFVPLQKYGFVDPQAVTLPDGTLHPNEAYRTWVHILTVPGGPDEFPVDQLVAYRWYDPAICPVPSARFLQLVGVQVQRIWCPECETIYYHKANYLARHLRTVHHYDRAEIMAIGQELGISFAKEITSGRNAVEMVGYDVPPELAPEPEPLVPVIEMDDTRPRGRRP